MRNIIEEIITAGIRSTRDITMNIKRRDLNLVEISTSAIIHDVISNGALYGIDAYDILRMNTYLDQIVTKNTII